MVWSHTSKHLLGAFVLSISHLACTSPNDTAPEQPAPTVERPATADLPCNDAWGIVPGAWTQLSHDDGQGNADLTSQSWSIGEISLSSANLVEATRFDIDRPARIVGISVQYGALPEAGRWPLTLGLHRDFGHNGFDFWPMDALWEGSRCRVDIEAGQWVDYVLPEPITMTQPEPIYVVHRRDSDESGALLFDGTDSGDCDESGCCKTFDACHSALNLPELTNHQNTPFWNGLSFAFQYDYMVRLYVEYLDDDTTKLFETAQDYRPSKRMAWGDVDGDGDQDLLLQGPRLMQNTNGIFQEAVDTGLPSADQDYAGVWGDLNNDGCLDLFLFSESTTRSNRLYKNDCDGSFTEITELSTITNDTLSQTCNGGTFAPTPAAAWADIDADGLLDLYVTHFICWSTGEFYQDRVWRNLGQGRFEELTGSNGFWGTGNSPLASRGVYPLDADLDGDIDLFINNYRLHRNQFFQNQGNGTVTEAARDLQLQGRASTLSGSTTYGHSIGSAWGDLDNDGDFDAVIANLAHPRFYDFSDKTEVLIQDNGSFTNIQGSFEQPQGETGIRFQETHSVPVLADFNLDGNLDLIISATYDGRPTDVYLGEGNGSFLPYHFESGILEPNGWGLAVADFNQDGKPDVASKTQLFQNQASGDETRWYEFTVVGDETVNRAGIGTTLIATLTDGSTRIKQVSGGSGQGCQDSLTVHFSMPRNLTIKTLTLRFPGGKETTFQSDALQENGHTWLYESGRHVPGFEQPEPR
jgi:hypothetical protein